MCTFFNIERVRGTNNRDIFDHIHKNIGIDTRRGLQKWNEYNRSFLSWKWILKCVIYDSFTKLFAVGAAVVGVWVWEGVVGTGNEGCGIGVVGGLVLKIFFASLFLAIVGRIMTVRMTLSEKSSAPNSSPVVTDIREQSKLRFRSLVRNGLSSSSSISRKDFLGPFRGRLIKKWMTERVNPCFVGSVLRGDYTMPPPEPALNSTFHHSFSDPACGEEGPIILKRAKEQARGSRHYSQLHPIRLSFLCMSYFTAFSTSNSLTWVAFLEFYYKVRLHV